MSRSIHTTHRDIEYEKRFINEDKDKIRKIYKELAKKRNLKEQKKSIRENMNIVAPAVSPDAIPIHIVETGKNIHYPASPDDLRAMLCRMTGVFGGISEIRLSLGAKDQEEYQNESEWLSPDPHTGRLGYEIIPGVYEGPCRGVYHIKRSLIQLFGYVYDDSLPDIRMWELYFRLKMLSTFAHELGHHYDYLQRWQMMGNSKDKDESIAERLEYRWIHDHVIPYLSEAYPAEVKQFHDWIEEHGGMSVPLDMLVEDPRVTEKNGMVRMVFGGIPSAVETLAEDAANGETPEGKKMGFAWNLHINDEYDKTLELLERILKQNPKNVESLVLKADTLVHIAKYDAAKAIVDNVLENDGKNIKAWMVLADIYEYTENWSSLLFASLHALSLVSPEQPEWVSLRCNCAIAKIELGDNAGAEAELSDIEANGGVRGASRANRIRSRYLTSED